MKTWLKGGLTGGIIYFIFALFSMIILLDLESSSLLRRFIESVLSPLMPFVRLAGWFVPERLLAYLVAPFMYFILGFIIGAIIGLIIQKIKK